MKKLFLGIAVFLGMVMLFPQILYWASAWSPQVFGIHIEPPHVLSFNLAKNLLQAFGVFFGIRLTEKIIKKPLDIWFILIYGIAMYIKAYIELALFG